MSFSAWILFFVTFIVFTFFAAVGDANVADGSVLDSILGFQVDKISQGGGFIGAIRVVVAFFTTTLPTWATWNYNFLQGDLEIIRWFLSGIFGGTFVIMVAMQFVGLRQNV